MTQDMEVDANDYANELKKHEHPFLHACSLAGQLPFVAATGALVEGIGMTALVVKHLPKAIVRAYQTAYRTKKLGPNLKGLCYVLIPETGVLIIPMTGVFSGLWGVGSSVGRFLHHDGSWRKVWDKAWGDIKSVDKGIIDAMVEINEYAHEDLPADEKPIDIHWFKALKALLAGTISSPINVVGLTLIGLYHLPHGLWLLLRGIWSDTSETILLPFQFVGSLILMAASPLAAALLPIAGAGFGLRNGCYITYKKGFRAAMRETFKTMVDGHREISKALAGKD